MQKPPIRKHFVRRGYEVRGRSVSRLVALAGMAPRRARPERATQRDDYVFASSTGTPLDGRKVVREVFEPARRRAQLPPLRSHDLRHIRVPIQQAAHPKVIS